MNKSFGNFKFTLNVKKMTVLVQGQKFGWNAEYPLDEIGQKITFYRVMVKKAADGRGASYRDIVEGLKWSKRMLEE